MDESAINDKSIEHKIKYKESEHEVNKSGNNFTEKIRENPWIFSTIILGILVLVLLVGNFSGFTGSAITGSTISEADAGQKILNLAETEVENVELIEVNMKSGLYEIILSIDDREVPVYMTKDGKYFTSILVDIEELNENSPESQNPTPSSQQPPAQEVTAISIDDDAIKGNINAPVTIVEFSDYECPFCGRHFTQTLPQIISKYVDTGKVRLVFRDFPLGFHKNAQKAAEAAECAGDQGKYWEMHDKLFKNQQVLDIANLKKYAEDVGLNTANFNSCLDSGVMEKEVKKDISDGQGYGVSGTPAFFINGRMLTGAQPFSEFEKVIEEELVKAS